MAADRSQVTFVTINTLAACSICHRQCVHWREHEYDILCYTFVLVAMALEMAVAAQWHSKTKRGRGVRGGGPFIAKHFFSFFRNW